MDRATKILAAWVFAAGVALLASFPLTAELGSPPVLLSGGAGDAQSAK